MTREEFIKAAKELAIDFWGINLTNGTYESNFIKLLDKYESKKERTESHTVDSSKFNNAQFNEDDKIRVHLDVVDKNDEDLYLLERDMDRNYSTLKNTVLNYVKKRNEVDEYESKQKPYKELLDILDYWIKQSILFRDEFIELEQYESRDIAIGEINAFNRVKDFVLKNNAIQTRHIL